jgi:hypothetical protein
MLDPIVRVLFEFDEGVRQVVLDAFHARKGVLLRLRTPPGDSIFRQHFLDAGVISGS